MTNPEHMFHVKQSAEPTAPIGPNKLDRRRMSARPRHRREDGRLTSAWSGPALDALGALYANNVPADDISELLGCTPDAARMAARRAGFRRPAPPEIRDMAWLDRCLAAIEGIAQILAAPAPSQGDHHAE